MRSFRIPSSEHRRRVSRLDKVRLQLERLEDRNLLSNGQWLTHITGLPGDTRRDQIEAANVLLHDAGLSGSPIQVIDHMGADGILLIQTATDIDQSHLTRELRVVPGFDYVEDYNPDDDPDSRRSYFPTPPSQENDAGNRPRIQHSSPTGTPLGPDPPPPVSGINGFEGINPAQSGNFRPPDTDGAVGPSAFLEHVNTALAIYDKTTGAARVGPVSDSTFYAPLGGTLNFSDPVTVYDEIRQRFVTAALDYSFSTNQFRLDVAMSRTSDPATLTSADWNFFRFDTNDHVGGSSVLSDYPKMGYNADGYMFSFNMFPNSFDHTSVLAVRADGTSPGIQVVPGGFTHFTFGPASMHGSMPGDPMWFTETPGASGNAAGNTVRLVRMDNPYSATPTFTYTTLTVNGYFGTSNPHQPGGLISGNANLGTRMYFSELRNVAGVTHLVAAHTVADTNGGFSRVHWYDFNVTNPATPNLIQQGEINPGANIDVLMPCMAINSNGAIGLQYMQTSGTEFVSMYFTGRGLTDLPGTMQTPVLAKAGLGNLNPSDRIGDYSFTSVDPVDGTFWGTNEYGGTTGSPNWRTWIQHFRAEPPAGPSVVSQTPTNNAFGQVSSIRLGFDESIDVSTFTSDKIRSFTDPAGNHIDILDITSVPGSNDAQFDLSFAPQATLGVYTILLGPDVEDTLGHQMDQNHNGIPGEDPGDVYTGHFAINGPKITSSTLADAASVLPGALTSVQVTFNEAMDPATFTTAQVVFTGPGGTFTAASVTPVSGSGNTRFTIAINAAAATITGHYTMTVGPNILDTFGNAMDQDGDFITGGVPDDQFILHFDVQGLKITASTDQNGVPLLTTTTANYLPGRLTAVQLTFNEAVAPATFNRFLVVFSSPSGPVFYPTSVTPVAGSGNARFLVQFSTMAFTTGAYTLTVAPGMQDTFGNLLDQNGNLIPGEIPGDEYVLHFNTLGPRITSSQAIGDSTNQVYNTLRVTFNEAMDPATFTPAAVRLVAPGGTVIAATGVSPVAGSSNTQFDIAFPPQGRIGNYMVTIGPNIRDPFGNQMDQNGNLITGEVPGDQYTTMFTVNGPRVTFISPTSSLEPVGSLRVTFNKPIDPSTFTATKIVSFSGPNGPVGISGVFSVPNTNFTSFDIFFTPQSSTGTYTMVIGPDIRDLSDNQMDQNGNLIPGEIPGDQYRATFQVGSLRVTSSTSGSQPTPVDHVRLTFNEPVNPASFTAGQVVSFTGPTGAITVTSVAAVPLSGNTQFDVFFAGQGRAGTYTMVVGPHIRDLYGNEMDQNGNFIPGEDPGDRYTATFSIAAPQVVANTLTGRTVFSGTTTARFTFSRSMDVTTFTTNQFQIVAPGGATQAVTAVNVTPNTNATQFDITFALTAGSGTYRITVGPNLMDSFGNPLASAFTGTFNVVGPLVTATNPSGPTRPPVDRVRVTFNQPMNPATFTTARAVLTGPNGPIDVTAVTPVAGSSNTQFDVAFAAQTVVGAAYTLVIGPGIQDPSGNSAPQFTAQFTLANILNVLYVGSRSTSWGDASTMVFTRISTSQFATQSLAGFDVLWVDSSQSGAGTILRNRAADISAFVSAGGGLITDDVFDTFDWVPNATGVTQHGGFAGDTVHITPLGMTHPVTDGLTDAGLSNWGNSWHAYYNPVGGMDVLATSADATQALLLVGSFGSGRLVYFGGDPTSHQPIGQSVQLLRQATQWVGNYHPNPVVSSVTPSGDARPPVDHAVVTFNTPIDPTKFTTDQVVFTGPNGPIDITDVSLVAGSNNKQFTVTFETQTDLGAYTLVIGPGIMDFFGNSVPRLTDNITLTDDVVLNGGFETGNFGSAWTPGGGAPTPVVTNTRAHSGTWSAFLGSLNTSSEPSGNSFIKQTITVPSGNPMLSFWYYPNTTDTITHDQQEAQIQSTSGATLAQVLRVASNAQVWTQVTFDLTPFAGQMVVLYFNVHQDGFGDPTGMFLDDVTVFDAGGGGRPAPPADPGRGSGFALGVPQPLADGNLLAALTSLLQNPSRAAAPAEAVLSWTSEPLAQPFVSTGPNGRTLLFVRSEGDSTVRPTVLPAADGDDLWSSFSQDWRLL